MDFEFPENMARDSFWTSSLNKMFEATEGPDDICEFVSMKYLLLRPTSNFLFVVRLPENAEDLSEGELEKYIDVQFDELVNSLPPQPS